MKLNDAIVTALLSFLAFKSAVSQCVPKAVGVKRYFECIYKNDFKPFKKALNTANTNYRNVTVSFYSSFIPELTSQLIVVPGGYYLINLTISRCKMDKIVPNAFSPFPKLEVLVLDHNNLSVLEASSFNSSTKLKLLDLSYSNVSNILLDAFSGLASLESLDLSHNGISILKDWMFKDLHFVKYLNVSYNAIKRVEANTFNSAINLVELNLGNNQIEALPICFTYLNLLRRLDISNNRLSQFSPRLFTGLISLSLLDVSNNQLKEIIWGVYNEAPALKQFDVSGNPITVENFRLEQFPKTLGLANISLERNKLQCAALAGLIGKFKLVGVSVKRGNELQEVNINGVACSDDEPVADDKTSVYEVVQPANIMTNSTDSSIDEAINNMSSQLTTSFSILYVCFAIMLLIYLVNVVFYDRYCRRRRDSRNMKELQPIM